MQKNLPRRFLNYSNSYFYIAVTLTILILVWEALSAISGTTNFPHIRDVADVFFQSFSKSDKIASQGGGDKGLYPHVLTTLFYHLLGLIFGMIAGVLLSLFLYIHQTARKVITPFIGIFRILPPLVFVPFLLLFCDNVFYSKFLLVSIYVVYAIVVYALNSLDNIARNFIELGIIYQASARKKVFDILLPAMLPGLRGGLRVTITISLGTLVVAEYMGPYYGLGKILKYAISFSDIQLLLVASIWAGIVVFIVDMLFSFILSRLTRWA